MTPSGSCTETWMRRRPTSTQSTWQSRMISPRLSRRPIRGLTCNLASPAAPMSRKTPKGPVFLTKPSTIVPDWSSSCGIRSASVSLLRPGRAPRPSRLGSLAERVTAPARRRARDPPEAGPEAEGSSLVRLALLAVALRLRPAPLLRAAANSASSRASSSASSNTCSALRSTETTRRPGTSVPRLKYLPILIGMRTKPSFTAPMSTKTPNAPELVTVPS
mmetsp:Transcript_21786/g.48799  ORF Transcript_21786/g.48799 Transcript_21786/m.48799 type:complete len:219 (+) Transcript_21786:1240-1896(+)